MPGPNGGRGGPPPRGGGGRPRGGGYRGGRPPRRGMGCCVLPIISMIMIGAVVALCVIFI